ncbi:copper homeostasis protein CutC [uncultured Maritalea sp.]|mgnify:CR=1 FL=1|uniref:copper homeostasis protein CutC n=1 Tax=uncultured Maritalea sp. TaxID=757249 RepID=UPI002629C7D8|nr:copper homeostasis protein CutC [uncultured Maritalea sp.]
MAGVILEICVDSLASLEAAVAGGANRIELCAALSEGGLTPSYGFMRAAQRFDVCVHAMIRLRGGDFCYSTAEIDIMCADIVQAKSLGLAGVVLGVARADNRLDLDALAKLRSAASGMECTLHRVIDLTPDPVAAVQQARSVGIDRILTSGGAKTAIEGKDTIAQMVEAAKEQLEIMPGSGVDLSNVETLLGIAGINNIHASCSAWQKSSSGKVEAMSFTPAQGVRQTITKNVSNLRQLIDSVRLEVANV